MSRAPALELVRGAAIAVTKTIEALQDGDVEYAYALAAIADEHLVELLERREAA